MNRHSSLVLIGILLFSAFACAQESNNQPRLITVTGTAEQKVAPDEVMLRLGVETRNKDLNAAKLEADSIVKRVIGLSKSFGIAEDDLQTSELNIEPSYDDNDTGKKFQYFELQRSIAIRLKDVTKFEGLLTALLQAGVNKVEETDFRIREPRKYQDEIRALAIQDAHEKAMLIAHQLNVQLGKVHSVTDLNEGMFFSNFGRAQGYAFSTAPSESSYVLGKVTISASVGASYEIE